METKSFQNTRSSFEKINSIDAFCWMPNILVKSGYSGEFSYLLENLRAYKIELKTSLDPSDTVLLVILVDVIVENFGKI